LIEGCPPVLEPSSVIAIICIMPKLSDYMFIENCPRKENTLYLWATWLKMSILGGVLLIIYIKKTAFPD